MIRLILLLLLMCASAFAGGGGMYPVPMVYQGGSEPIISDDFSIDTSSNYTDIIGTMTVSGGAAHGASWVITASYNTTPTGSTSHWVSATCNIASTSTSDSACVMFGSDGTDYYRVSFESGNILLVSDESNLSLSAAYAYSNGDTIEVVAQIDNSGANPVIDVWAGGNLIYNAVTDTLSGNVVGQYVGCYIDNNTANNDPVVDNLQGGEGSAL